MYRNRKESLEGIKQSGLPCVICGWAKTKETSKVKTEVWQLPAEDTKDAKLSFICNKFLAYMDDAYSGLENLADTNYQLDFHFYFKILNIEKIN